MPNRNHGAEKYNNWTENFNTGTRWNGRKDQWTWK